MSGHYIETCKECGRIIGQCRCMNCDKIAKWSICEKCKAKSDEGVAAPGNFGDDLAIVINAIVDYQNGYDACTKRVTETMDMWADNAPEKAGALIRDIKDRLLAFIVVNRPGDDDEMSWDKAKGGKP